MKTIMPEDAQIVHDIEQTFKTKYNSSPSLFCSPGRINLIGEHTDYNDGLVLPAAIDKHIILAIGKREDNAIRLYSLDQDQFHVTALDTLERSPLLWPDYILGVVQQLVNRGHTLQGFNLVFGGDIPQGAG